MDFYVDGGVGFSSKGPRNPTACALQMIAAVFANGWMGEADPVSFASPQNGFK